MCASLDEAQKLRSTERLVRATPRSPPPPPHIQTSLQPHTAQRHAPSRQNAVSNQKYRPASLHLYGLHLMCATPPLLEYGRCPSQSHILGGRVLKFSTCIFPTTWSQYSFLVSCRVRDGSFVQTTDTPCANLVHLVKRDAHFAVHYHEALIGCKPSKAMRS